MLPLREALADNDEDGVPDRLGQRVEIIGVALLDPFVERMTGKGLVYIQDRTRGATLDAHDPSLLIGTVARGDSLRVRGVVGLFKGEEDFVVERVERLGTGTVPPARDVLASDLHGERFAGQLVRVAGELSVFEDETGWLAGTLRDRSGDIPVRVDNRLLQDPGFVDRLRRGGEARIVGIASQRDTEPPYDGGYILILRTHQDLSFAPVPPYRAIGTAAGALLLLGFMLYLFTRRRGAERRAQEMERLMSALRKSEAQLREVLEGVRAIVWERDGVSGAFTYISRGVEEILGYEPREWYEDLDLWAETIHPADREWVAQASMDRMNGGRDSVLEYRGVRRDGRTVWLRDMTRVTSDDEGTPERLRGVMIDITEEKELEGQLRQAQKMEAIGRLAGGVAHDFNNILTAIQGETALALMGLEDERIAEHLGQVQENARRAATLTRQLLAFSRQQFVRPEPLDPNRAVAGMEGMLSRLIGEDIVLTTALTPGLGHVSMDPGQFEQVVMNLILNARDAMPQGGRIMVATRRVELGEAHAEDLLYPVPPGEYVLLSISDMGDGMSEELQERIFEPFFTTRDQGKGTGLGLATVYGIVKHAGGSIRVRSEVGEGTTFDLYLPRRAAGPSTDRAGTRAPRTGASIKPGEHRRSETVLVVEDEAPVRSLVRKVLRQQGFRVLEAGNGREALRVVQEHPGPIDLVLSDVVMPVMGGRELAEHLARSHPELHLIFMSGYTEDEILRRGIEQSEVAFLEKPFTPADLIDNVRVMLDADVIHS